MNHKNMFVKMEELDIFLGYSLERYEPNTYIDNVIDNNMIVNKIFKFARIFYKRDLDWYIHVDTVIPKKFMLRFFSNLTKLDLGTISKPFPGRINLGTITNDLEIDVDFGKF